MESKPLLDTITPRCIQMKGIDEHDICYVCLEGACISGLVSLGCQCNARVHPGCAAEWYCPRIRVSHCGGITEPAWRLKYSCACCVCSEPISEDVSSFIGEVTRSFISNNVVGGMYELDMQSIKMCVVMYFDIVYSSDDDDTLEHVIRSRWEVAKTTIHQLARATEVIIRCTTMGQGVQLFVNMLRTRTSDVDVMLFKKLNTMSRICMCVLVAHLALIVVIIIAAKKS